MRWVLVLLALVAGGPLRAGAQDTVRLRLPSGDAVVDALLYRAPGGGVHPTVLLLHGYPGNQQNSDIAQAASAAGWNVVLMHYRGTWSITGSFSVENALADVRTVLAALRAPDLTAQWGLDGERIALIGHSMGGAIALSVSARDPAVRCVAGLAPANPAVAARAAGANAAFRAGWIAALEAPTRVPAPPVRFAPGANGADMADYLVAHADSLDLVNSAPLLAGRPVLLVGGSEDRLASPAEHVQPLLDALKAAGAQRVTSAILPDDHNFSGGRGGLVELVVRWLRAWC